MSVSAAIVLTTNPASSPPPAFPRRPWGGAADRRKGILNIAVDGPNSGFVKSRRQFSCFCHRPSRYNTSVRGQDLFCFFRQRGGQPTGTGLGLQSVFALMCIFFAVYP